MEDSLGHGILPVPLAGQTITVINQHGVRVGAGDGERRARPGLDGRRTVLTAQTPAHTPFTMGPFKGRVETIDLGGGAVAWVLRNFDGANGVTIARSMEGCFGKDAFEAKGSGAKCAAAQGNNCQDSYTKVWPRRMFLDQNYSELMRPVLDGAMAAVNGSLPRGTPTLDLRQPREQPRGPGGTGSEITAGESQVLRFKAVGKAAAGHGDRMHTHIDKPGTRWVAIVSLGETSTFLFDNALKCQRCFARSRKPEDKRKHIVPNLNQAGTGVNKTADKKGAKDWHRIPCKGCKELQLRSGDTLLFHGAPESNVAHGSLGTRRGEAPVGRGAGGPPSVVLWEPHLDAVPPQRRVTGRLGSDSIGLSVYRCLAAGIRQRTTACGRCSVLRARPNY